MTRTDDYRKEAIEDAADMAENFLAEIVEALIDDRKASDDINNDYPDGDAYHHETHVDKAYTLLEAAQLLDQLDEYEETDWGLWEGQKPRDAIGTQAAYTYGAAVGCMFSSLIDEINDDDDLSDLLDEYEAVDDGEKESDQVETQQDAIRERVQARVAEIIKGFKS